jgi:hypothetical protein
LHFSKLLNRLAVLNSEIGLFAGDGVGDGDGVNDGEVVVGLAITTPLFQSNFFPDLIQVKVFPEATEVLPALGQVAPALTAANAGRDREEPRKVIATSAARVLFMLKGYLSGLALSVVLIQLL